MSYIITFLHFRRTQFDENENTMCEDNKTEWCMDLIHSATDSVDNNLPGYSPLSNVDRPQLNLSSSPEPCQL
ncbi:hypothetical protein QCA50_005256 [Cerrena zonata]|uniref:Uncharacterized protein n=1 Tax=Cerrena zonata TaxID=2478898 RepID=A0AAW0GGU7_9APHY